MIQYVREILLLSNPYSGSKFPIPSCVHVCHLKKSPLMWQLSHVQACCGKVLELVGQCKWRSPIYENFNYQRIASYAYKIQKHLVFGFKSPLINHISRQSEINKENYIDMNVWLGIDNAKTTWLLFLLTND